MAAVCRQMALRQRAGLLKGAPPRLAVGWVPRERLDRLLEILPAVCSEEQQ